MQDERKRKEGSKRNDIKDKNKKGVQKEEEGYDKKGCEEVKTKRKAGWFGKERRRGHRE